MSDLAPFTPQPLDRNPAAVYLSALSVSGRESMTSKLKRVAAFLDYDDPLLVPWAELRFQHVAAVRTKLQADALAPATVNATLAALKGVARAAFSLGLLSAEEHERIRSVKSVRGHREPAGRSLTSEERNKLLHACAQDETPAGVRDASIVALLYGCGLRRSEVAAAMLADLTLEEGHRCGSLLVHGKGNRERTAYLNNDGVLYIVQWLKHRGHDAGSLFCPVNKAGRVARQGLTSQAVYNALRKRAEEANVREFSPHDLRRTFVGDLLDAGVDIVTVQRMAGHAQVTTTARYDRRGEEVQRQAAGMLNVPYKTARMDPAE